MKKIFTKYTLASLISIIWFSFLTYHTLKSDTVLLAGIWGFTLGFSMAMILIAKVALYNINKTFRLPDDGNVN